MEKKDIRRQIAAARRALTGSELMEKSLRICDTILALDIFREAKSIYVYMDCKGEVSMRPLIEAAWRLGKTVAAPKVYGNEMTYYEISDYDDVQPGYYDIPEPVTGRVACDEYALLIVPGVGFDAHRHRCGYGKGFYDRYLAAHPGHTTVAAAFEFQIVDEVPANEFDISPQYLVTEERIFADSGTQQTSVGE